MNNTTTVITICVAFVLVLVIGLNAGSGNALFNRLVHGGVSVPRRVISQEELTRFTTTGTSGEIVMIGTLGLLLDQGNQAINITTDDILFLAGSTPNIERVRIKGSNGNVGIGTTNPLSTLSVNGTGMFSGSVGIGTTSMAGAITLHTSTAPTVPFGVGVSSYDNSAIVIGNVGSGALSFSYNPTVYTGYIGISGGSNTTWQNIAYGASSHSFYTSNNIGTVGIGTNNYLPNPTLLLSSSGKIGIGTNSPLELLHVAGNMAVGSSPLTNSSTTFKCYVPKSTYNGGLLTNPIYGNNFTIYSGDMSTTNWGRNITASQLYLRAGHLLDSTTTIDNRTSTNYKGGSVYIMSGSVSMGNTSVTSTTYVPGDIIMTTGSGALNQSSQASSSSVSISDQERFRISGQTGYVGIGTTSPSSALHVYNPLSYTAFTNKIPSQFIISGSSYTLDYPLNGRLYLGNLSDSNGTLSVIQSALFNSFSNIDNAKNLSINPLGGNIGMGTTDPYKLLHISGNSTGNISALISNTNTSLNSSASLQFGLWSASGSGTGTSSPAAQLSAICMNAMSGNTDLAFSTYTGTSVSPNYTLVERMRITANGNVGIGTLTTSNQLNVYANAAGEVGMRVQNGSNSSSSYSIIRLQNDYTNGVNLFLNSSTRTADGGINTATLKNHIGSLRLQTSDATKGIIIDDPNGNVTVYGSLTTVNGFYNSSDKRIKKNITPILDSLTHLHSLRPVSFEYIDSTVGHSNTLGFIADEVHDILPQSINYTKGFIPNILQSLPFQLVEGHVIIEYSHPDMTTDKKVKIIIDKKDSIAHVLSTTSSHITLQLDSIPETATLFLYGTEVDDFKSIDNNMIVSLTVSAVQELDKKYQQELSSLKERMAAQEARMAELLAMFQK